jgi:hypothetical protein
VLYRFVLGETQCALMVRPADPAVVDELIQAFKAEAGLSPDRFVVSQSGAQQQSPQPAVSSSCLILTDSKSTRRI